MSESRLDAKANRILHRNNAQEIVKALADLEEHRAEFATRWLWELIQNARDFPDEARPMTICVSVLLEQITFAHNGRDFTEDEILSLILHGSTKQSNPAQLGKFGTGFLSTHLLSKQVRVEKERCATTTVFGKLLNSTSTGLETTPNKLARRCNGRSGH